MWARLAAFGLVATILAMLVAGAAVQQNAPSSSTGQNPIARSVTERQMLEQSGRAHGLVSIPDPKEAILEQPQGRTFQHYRERLLPWIGGVLILGMIVLLGAFYLWKGPVRLGLRLTGTRIIRFILVERFIHWLTAASFIVLAITGLNYIFGKRLLLPLIGAQPFSAWSQWAKFLHNGFAWPFIVGLVLVIAMWIRHNLPDRYDLVWLKGLGGFVSGRHPPARRFNAGQKLIFWSVALGGTLMVLSGLILLFPFWLLDVNGMQLAHYVHATLGMLMIAIIIAHIYIGTIGMEGASDAMVSGDVDLAWAEAHHSAWVEEERARTPAGPQVGMPAE